MYAGWGGSVFQSVLKRIGVYQSVCGEGKGPGMQTLELPMYDDHQTGACRACRCWCVRVGRRGGGYGDVHGVGVGIFVESRLDTSLVRPIRCIGCIVTRVNPVPHLRHLRIHHPSTLILANTEADAAWMDEGTTTLAVKELDLVGLGL